MKKKKEPIDMTCYICKKEIQEGEPYLKIGKNKNGIWIVRHDDEKHEEIVLEQFLLSMRKSVEIHSEQTIKKVSIKRIKTNGNI